MNNVTMSRPTGKFAFVYRRHAVKASLSSTYSYRALWAHRSYTSAAVIKGKFSESLRLYTINVHRERHCVTTKKTDPSSNPILTKSLSATGREKWEIGRRTDSIDQSKIIGKKIRDVVISKKGEEFRIHKPTLGEYITYCPRIVTPVSLLDVLPQVNG